MVIVMKITYKFDMITFLTWRAKMGKLILPFN